MSWLTNISIAGSAPLSFLKVMVDVVPPFEQTDAPLLKATVIGDPDAYTLESDFEYAKDMSALAN